MILCLGTGVDGEGDSGVQPVMILGSGHAGVNSDGDSGVQLVIGHQFSSQAPR